MIPSWRKRKAQERKRRDYVAAKRFEGMVGTPPYQPMGYEGLRVGTKRFNRPLYREDGYLSYCPNCGHRFDRVGHEFSCGETGSVRGGGGPPSGF